MPVETEDTAECLEPERIGQATQQLLGTAIGNDVCGDLAREARHPRKQPRWRSAGMQRKVGEAGATGHVSSYGFLRRRYVNDGPGFWIQSKVPDELSVNQASRVELRSRDSRSR